MKVFLCKGKGILCLSFLPHTPTKLQPFCCNSSQFSLPLDAAIQNNEFRIYIWMLQQVIKIKYMSNFHHQNTQKQTFRISGLVLNTFIGCSIFLYSCLDQAIRPATGGKFLGIRGSALYFWYAFLMASRSFP